MRKLARSFVDKLIAETPNFRSGELIWKKGVKEVKVKLEERFLFFRKPRVRVYVNKVPVWIPLFQKIRLRRHIMKLLYNRIIGDEKEKTEVLSIR